MATQTLTSDAVLAASGTGTASTVYLQSQDAQWIVAASTTSNPSIRSGIQNPGANTPSTGAGLQTARVQTKKQGGTGTPTATISVGFAGTKVLTSSSFNVTSTTGQINDFTFDWQDLLTAGAAADGSNFEMWIDGLASGGGPSARASVDTGYMAWIEYYVVAGTAIEPDDSAHSHSSESPTVAAKSVVTVNDALHGHTAESPTVFSPGTPIEPDDSLHSHAAESPTIAAKSSISVNDGLHGHASESPSVATNNTITANDALHGHTAESPTVSSGISIEPQDALHAHAAESPSISTNNTVEPVDASHGLSSDSPTITAKSVVAPVDAIHGHSAESPSLVYSPPASSGSVDVSSCHHDISSSSSMITLRRLRHRRIRSPRFRI